MVYLTHPQAVAMLCCVFIYFEATFGLKVAKKFMDVNHGWLPVGAKERHRMTTYHLAPDAGMRIRKSGICMNDFKRCISEGH